MHAGLHSTKIIHVYTHEGAKQGTCTHLWAAVISTPNSEALPLGGLGLGDGKYYIPLPDTVRHVWYWRRKCGLHVVVCDEPSGTGGSEYNRQLQVKITQLQLTCTTDNNTNMKDNQIYNRQCALKQWHWNTCICWNFPTQYSLNQKLSSLCIMHSSTFNLPIPKLTSTWYMYMTK